MAQVNLCSLPPGTWHRALGGITIVHPHDLEGYLGMVVRTNTPKLALYFVNTGQDPVLRECQDLGMLVHYQMGAQRWLVVDRNDPPVPSLQRLFGEQRCATLLQEIKEAGEGPMSGVEVKEWKEQGQHEIYEAWTNAIFPVLPVRHCQSGVHVGFICDASLGQIVGVRYTLPGQNHDLCKAEFDKLPPEEQADYVEVPPPDIDEMEATLELFDYRRVYPDNFVNHVQQDSERLALAKKLGWVSAYTQLKSWAKAAQMAKERADKKAATAWVAGTSGKGIVKNTKSR